jgi:hypothetical protein
MFKRGLLLVAIASFALVTACKEDLGPITKVWEALQGDWMKKIEEFTKQGGDLAGKVKGLAALAAGDAAGADLKGKLDAALGEHGKALTDLKGVLTGTKDGIAKAIMEGKIAPVQAAIDDGKKKWDAATKKVADLTGTASGAFDALKKHTEAEAAKAAAATTAVGDVGAKDAEVLKKGGETSFALTYKADGTIDMGVSEATLARFLKFMNTCEVLKVELTGMGKDDKLGLARATAAKKYVETKGVPGSRVAKTAGKAGEGGLMAKVTKPCP